LQSTEEGKLLEHYDHILVDEAQYFAPLYYELIKKSLKPHSGQLYLAYDENQGFLKSRLHLQDTGLDLRGHSMRLLSSYRLNPAIMRAAHAVHLNQLPNQSDDIFAKNGHGKHAETKPRLLHFHSEQDEQTRLLKEIHDLVHAGHPVKDILVLTTDPGKAHPLAASIRKLLKLPVDLPTLAHHNPDALQVCPLEAATGLESANVFISGIQDLFEIPGKKQHPDNNALLIENTRKLYMGMTRAYRQLTLMISAERIPKSLITRHIDIPTLADENIKDQAEAVHYLHG
jgi:superfamily I DNA/RNA helicase